MVRPARELRAPLADDPRGSGFGCALVLLSETFSTGFATETREPGSETAR
jgi:hypothetical protein